MYKQVFQIQSELLKSLSHPKRLEIVNLIRDRSMNVSDMVAMLDLPQANLSQHLSVLRLAGVVSTSKKGKEVYYSISHPNVVAALDMLREMLIQKYQGDKLANELTMKMTDLVPVVTDPICKMRVSPKTAGFALEHEGETYYFCASGCMKKFAENIGVEL